MAGVLLFHVADVFDIELDSELKAERLLLRRDVCPHGHVEVEKELVLVTRVSTNAAMMGECSGASFEGAASVPHLVVTIDHQCREAKEDLP